MDTEKREQRSPTVSRIQPHLPQNSRVKQILELLSSKPFTDEKTDAQKCEGRGCSELGASAPCPEAPASAPLPRLLLSFTVRLPCRSRSPLSSAPQLPCGETALQRRKGEIRGLAVCVENGPGADCPRGPSCTERGHPLKALPPPAASAAGVLRQEEPWASDLGADVHWLSSLDVEFTPLTPQFHV